MRLPRFVSIVLLFLTAGVNAQQTAQQFTRHTNYLLYLPDSYATDTTKQWPLVLFLHGSGERGEDLAKVKVHGPPRLVEEGKKFPFILVSPQCELNWQWDEDDLHRLLQSVKKQYRVDQDRVYITGLSMGGFGAWALAKKYPADIAAIVPVCGGGDTSNAWKLRHVKIWAFHGSKDSVVFPSQSINYINAVHRNGNADARLTLYPEARHDSWTATYANDSVFDWMLAQRRFRYKEIAVDKSALQQQAGIYQQGSIVLEVLVKDGQLLLKTSEDIIPLKSAGNNLFFMQENRPVDFYFEPRGRDYYMIISGGDRSEFKRKK